MGGPRGVTRGEPTNKAQQCRKYFLCGAVREKNIYQTDLAKKTAKSVKCATSAHI